MAGDDLLDAYIAEALKSTGTRKAPKTDGPPVPAARQAAATTPPPAGRPHTGSAPPHSVVARTSSQVRTPTAPPNTARPAPSNAAPIVGRTPTPNAPAIGRTPTPSAVRPRSSSVPPRSSGVPATFDDSPLASIDRARPPKPTPPPPADRLRTPTAPPAIARTRSSSASPLAIARAQQLARASSTMLPQASELDTDFDEDTVPEAQAMTALTDQDDRGVRRS